MDYGQQPGQPNHYQLPPEFRRPGQGGSPTMKYALIGGIVVLFMMVVGGVMMFLLSRPDSGGSKDDDDETAGETTESDDAEAAPRSSGVGRDPTGDLSFNDGLDDDINQTLAVLGLECAEASVDAFIDSVDTDYYWKAVDDTAYLIDELKQALSEPLFICRYKDDPWREFRAYSPDNYRQLQTIVRDSEHELWPSLTESDCENRRGQAQEDFEERTLEAAVQINGYVFEGFYVEFTLLEDLDQKNVDYAPPDYIDFCS